MNNQQNSSQQSDLQQVRSKKNLPLIIFSVIISVLVLIVSGVGYTAYQNVQKEAEAAKVAREKAEKEKLELLQSKVEAEKRAAEERRRIEEAEERERQEKAALEEKQRIEREEKERIEREETERIERERREAEEQRQQEEANKPIGQVSDVQMKGDVRIVNGEFDAGFLVSGLVKNTNKSGDLKILAFLSCSEGEWVRTQHLYVSAGQSMRLSYFFHEPTVNASSCQARIMTKPV